MTHQICNCLHVEKHMLFRHYLNNITLFISSAIVSRYFWPPRASNNVRKNPFNRKNPWAGSGLECLGSVFIAVATTQQYIGVLCLFSDHNLNASQFTIRCPRATFSLCRRFTHWLSVISQGWRVSGCGWGQRHSQWGSTHLKGGNTQIDWSHTPSLVWQTGMFRSCFLWWYYFPIKA